MIKAGSIDDFNFLVGNWAVLHRRLKGRLVGSLDWEEFNGTSSMRKILGGLGNLEEHMIEHPTDAYRAVALRTFDPDKGHWAIWWLDARRPHSLDVPVHGGFENGVGLFFAEDYLDGQAIRIRFRWSEIEGDAPVWEQAFSADSGFTWETNWIMRFSRI